MSAAAIFQWAKLLAPLVLGNIPATRPLAGKIGSLMDEAEAIRDAKGKDKLAHVTSCAHQIGEAINATKPDTVDLDSLDGAVSGGIDTAFNIAKIVAASHGSPTGTAIPAMTPPEVPAVPLTPEDTSGLSLAGTHAVKAEHPEQIVASASATGAEPRATGIEPSATGTLVPGEFSTGPAQEEMRGAVEEERDAARAARRSRR